MFDDKIQLIQTEFLARQFINSYLYIHQLLKQKKKIKQMKTHQKI